MSLDYATFAHPSFDANEYANAILANQAYRPSDHQTNANATTLTNTATTNIKGGEAPEEISVFLAKLSFGIDDVNRQLKNVINVHHEKLLEQAASVNQLEGSLGVVKGGLKDIEGSVTRLRNRLSTPYKALQVHSIRLQKLQVASDVLRRVARFFMLSRRLEVQMSVINSVSITNKDGTNGASLTPRPASTNLSTGTNTGSGSGEDAEERERTIIKAALSVAEIFALVDAEHPHIENNAEHDSLIAVQIHEEETETIPPISLRALNAVSSHIPTVQNARDQIMTEMEAMLITGVQELNRPLLSSALLTAHNLRILPETVQGLLSDLIEVVEARIKSAFDMGALGREKGLKETPTSSASGLLYKSRVRTEPTNLTAPQWTNALWTRLENMIGDLGEACIKVYTLEKVLVLQKDATTGQAFLDEVMKVLENKPSSAYWSTLARTLEKSCREGAKTSTFLSQTLTSQYPRLLRLFQDFFSRISLHTDTIYTQAYQSPETVLTLRSVSTFETAYLQRSITRLSELIGSSFANSAAAYFGGGTYVGSGGYSVGGAGKAFPTEKDGLAIARVIANELDTSKFDPLLVKSSARGMVRCLDGLVGKVDNLASKDRSATTLVGPNSTVQQSLNASIVNAMYHCWLQLSKLPEGYSEGVTRILEPAIEALQASYLRITDPLLNAIRLDISAIISRLHRVDWSDNADAMARGMGGPSPYSKELADKLTFIRTEILSKYNVGELGQEWGLEIARHTLRTFVLHVSIIKPLGESGKLQLTNDMTQLELALTSLLSEGVAQGNTKQGWRLDVLGLDYRALRALRPLLFLENESLAHPEQTYGLPPLVVLHHILVRSPLLLTHKVHGWQESRYIRFVEEHTDEEIWSVLEQDLNNWRTRVLSEIEDAEDMGESGRSKQREKEEELREGQKFVELARRVLEHARASS